MTLDWTATFNETFRAPASAVMADVWAEVLGDEHMPGLDAFSYVTARGDCMRRRVLIVAERH